MFTVSLIDLRGLNILDHNVYMRHVLIDQPTSPTPTSNTNTHFSFSPSISSVCCRPPCVPPTPTVPTFPTTCHRISPAVPATILSIDRSAFRPSPSRSELWHRVFSCGSGSCRIQEHHTWDNLHLVKSNRLKLTLRLQQGHRLDTIVDQ
jgi:hypothetical protein